MHVLHKPIMGSIVFELTSVDHNLIQSTPGILHIVNMAGEAALLPITPEYHPFGYDPVSILTEALDELITNDYFAVSPFPLDCTCRTRTPEEEEEIDRRRELLIRNGIGFNSGSFTPLRDPVLGNCPNCNARKEWEALAMLTFENVFNEIVSRNVHQMFWNNHIPQNFDVVQGSRVNCQYIAMNFMRATVMLRERYPQTINMQPNLIGLVQ